MGYRYIKITPSLAEKYLETNTKNRVLRAGHVAYLTQLILNGEWRKTGEPIRFSGKLTDKNLPTNSATLLDGQHRLTAFLNSEKKSLNFEIIDELPADSFQYMDQGRPRSAADVLSIAGFKNTNVLAGVGRALYLFNRGGIPEFFSNSQGGIKRVTNHQVLEHVRKDEKQIQSAIKRTTKHLSKITMAFSAHATTYYLFRQKSVEDCERFFYQLGTGEKLSKTSPIQALRSIILEHRFSRKRAKHQGIRTRDLVLIDIMAWNAFREQKRIAHRNMLLEFDADNLPRSIK